MTATPQGGGCALGYLRVSTQAQGESGLGLDAQQAAIQATAARLGLRLVSTFIDAGRSGSWGLDHRPGLADALNALAPGDVLLVAKRDRVARDAFLAVLIEREVARKGARILSAAGEGTETDDPAAVFTRRILDAVSELERALIRARTRAAMVAAKARGQCVGNIAYGYRRVAGGLQLEADPQEQRILFEIRTRRARGLYYWQIADALNQEGYRSRTGAPFTHGQITKLSWIRVAETGV